MNVLETNEEKMESLRKEIADLKKNEMTAFELKNTITKIKPHGDGLNRRMEMREEKNHRI